MAKLEEAEGDEAVEPSVGGGLEDAGRSESAEGAGEGGEIEGIRVWWRGGGGSDWGGGGVKIEGLELLFEGLGEGGAEMGGKILEGGFVHGTYDYSMRGRGGVMARASGGLTTRVVGDGGAGSGVTGVAALFLRGEQEKVAKAA